MSNSYKKVNYLLRMRKQIERKLIIETLQHLDGYIDIRRYHYFGFGSVYFADFILFHKYLNIRKMTSIDDKVEDEKRFDFNIPYGFVKFKTCDCHMFLEKELSWDDRIIIWLDFDTFIDEQIIEDIEFVASKAKPMDIFFVTIEAESPDDPEEFLDKFDMYVPASLRLKSVKEEFPKTLNGVMVASIQNGLNNRTERSEFLQLFNITYRDTKKMYTFGGIFCGKDGKSKLEDRVKELPYIRHDNKIVEIDCPFITPREKMFLDKCIRKQSIDKRYVRTGLSKDDVDRYREYYKYYPQFFESIY